MNPKKRAVIFFVLGAVLGTLGDFCHVISLTDGYYQCPLTLPIINSPYWVPLVFGASASLFGFFHPLLDKLLSVGFLSHPFLRRGSVNLAHVCFGIALVLILWAASGFVSPEIGYAKDILLLVSAFVGWYLLDRTLSGIVIGLIAGVCGTLAEITMVNAGIFYYYPASAALFGVPSWLPWIYFIGSVSMGNLASFLERK